ncbi:hypothetical protein SASPL_119844 [Salvia splendens]|uniref:Core Histone H2A/H2B/H3 domain-containing protein n=1 Tax=Salvia splendens TaxID=180675 RepID=A0A8X8XNJ4_SALSN|nr:hypothetical protein SASPL_119844 [Salvia splendens]
MWRSSRPPSPTTTTPLLCRLKMTTKRSGLSRKRRKKERRKRKRTSGGEGYKTYLFKVMKQVHPEMGISEKAMVILNNLMVDMFERLADDVVEGDSGGCQAGAAGGVGHQGCH